MNDLTHFLFGLFLARFVFNYQFCNFESFFLSISSIIPDLDIILGLKHGCITHRLVVALLMAFFFSLLTYIIGFGFLNEMNITFLKMFGLSTVGVIGHLFLDCFTYFYSYETDKDNHQYFWPIWNFPIHLNTIFPRATFKVRILIEVIVFLSIFSSFVYKKVLLNDNPLLVFYMSSWESCCGKISKELVYYNILYYFNIILLLIMMLNPVMVVDFIKVKAKLLIRK